MLKSVGVFVLGIGVLAACGSVDDTGANAGSGGAQGNGAMQGNGGTQGSGAKPSNGGTHGSGAAQGNGGTQGSSGTQGSGGTQGSSGTQGTGGDGATTGMDGGNQSGDFGILSTCRAEACGSASAGLIENYLLQAGGDVGCLLRALQRRTPGRYRYATNATWTNGNSEVNYVLVVADDGSVTYARDYHMSISYSADGPMVTSGSDPARRCTLKPPSYWDACLAALAAAQGNPPNASGARDCLYGGDWGTEPGELGWFESCTSATPATCP